MQTILRTMLLMLLWKQFYIFRVLCKSLPPFLKGQGSKKIPIVLHAAELVGMGLL